MSYIGVQTQNQISPQFSREVITGTGTDTYTLIQDVPGFNADNIMVVVNNVIQEPNNAYTITEDTNGNPRILNFNGTNLASTDECYVQHRGVGTLNMTPAAGSVNAAALQDNLKSGNVDSYTANAGDTTFTLTETPLNVNTISVFVNGIYQKPTTNYTVSGTTLTLTAAAVAGDEVDVIHNTIRTTVTHVADQSVTTGKIANDAVTGAKIENNPTIAGNLTVSGTSTLTGNTTVGGNLTVSGTTTTIDTTVTTSDAMVVNNAGSDVGLKINSTSTGHILQLQDGGVDKVVVADGGNTTFSGNVLVDTIAEKTSANGVSIDGVTLKDGGGTFTGNVVIPNGGNIGSASDTDAISIASDGNISLGAGIVSGNLGTITQRSASDSSPTFSDNHSNTITLANLYGSTSITIGHPSNGDTHAWLAWDYGAGVTRKITKLQWFQDGGGSNSTGIFLEGSNVASPNASAGHSDWTQLKSFGSIVNDAVYSYSSPVTATTLKYRHYRIRYAWSSVNAGPIKNFVLEDTDSTFDVRAPLNAIGTAPTYACRAWVNFNGSTSAPIINASGNVSSITDNGTGDYTVNFTNNMPDIYYSVTGTNVGSTVGNFWSFIASSGADSNITVSSFRFDAVHVGSNYMDQTVLALAIFR